MNEILQNLSNSLDYAVSEDELGQIEGILNQMISRFSVQESRLRRAGNYSVIADEMTELRGLLEQAKKTILEAEDKVDSLVDHITDF